MSERSTPKPKPKARPKAKPKNNSPAGSSSALPGFWLALAGIFKEIGLLGFLVVFFAGVFYQYGTDLQKQAFIDKYILLKDIEGNPGPYILVVFGLIIGNVIQHVYYSMRLKAREEENKRLGVEKRELQETLLGKPLKSSD